LRKGLTSFLDALVVITDLSGVPPFAIWLIGGSPSESEAIHGLVSTRPRLASAWREGSLVIWGRVAREALPELYARSSLVVMPSKREQFGLVGVEAMMCGSPVVATAVGGLADIVLNGHTGTLVVPSSTPALANAIVGYLRNRDRSGREGANGARWCRFAFSRDGSCRRIAATYLGAPSQLAFPTRSDLRKLEIAELLAAFSTLGEPPHGFEDCSSSDHTSGVVTTSSGRYFCKWYRPERSDHVSTLPVSPALRRERTWEDCAARLRFYGATDLVPGVIRLPEAGLPLAIFNAHPPAPLREVAAEKAIARLARHFRAIRPLDSTDPSAARYLAALARVASRPDLQRVEEHDLAAAALNAQIFDCAPTFHQVHPHVELIRMRALLAQGAWAVEAEVRERLTGAMSVALDWIAFPVRVPALCHGSLKPQHLLAGPRGKLLACDTDNSRYVVGPFDEVHDVWYRVRDGSINVEEALATLSRAVPIETDLAVAWLLVYVVFATLLAVSCGCDVRQSRLLEFCRDFGSVFPLVHSVTKNRGTPATDRR